MREKMRDTFERARSQNKLPPGFLVNALGAAASSVSAQLFPEGHALEAITRPFLGALAHRGIDWVGEKAGRRIVVERSVEGHVEIWAEEDGRERRHFGLGEP
jgi:hypothetical protein